MDLVTKSIYKYLWHLLYYFAYLYDYCLWLRLRIIAFALWSYDLCCTTAQREEKDYVFLQECKRHLNKIPKHLNIIIGPENRQVNDELLIRIFSYALHMNIYCISYFDTRYTNKLESTKSHLIDLEKLDCPKGWKRKDINAHHSVWYICKGGTANGIKHNVNVVNGSSMSSKSPPSANGNFPNTSLTQVENNSLEIYEIKPQNNRALLARICQELFKQKHTSKVQSMLENRSSLSEHLSMELSHHLGNLTEPELCIIFNEEFCTFGMLPWHTRFTEFHQHASGKHFDVKAFAQILYKYSRCEQRWGK